MPAFLLLFFGWLKSIFSWIFNNPAWALAIVAAVVIWWQHHDIKKDVATIAAEKTQLAQAVADNKSNVATIGQLKAANAALINDLAIQKAAVAAANATITKINAALTQSISTARNILHDSNCTQGSASANGTICADIAKRLRQLDAALPH